MSDPLSGPRAARLHGAWSEMTAVDPAPFLAALGPDALLSGDALLPFAVDGFLPQFALLPPTADALAAVLALAAPPAFDDSAGLAVILHGGGSALHVGRPPDRYDLALDTRRLDRLIAYEPDDLTVTVEAGMSVARLHALLAARGQFLSFDVPFPTRATVGGALAAARSGPRRARFGGPRDWLIGCRIALPDGTLIRSGGRVVKNVSGYDLCKLFVGSFGTLGAIVEASFKLRPLPAADATLLLPTSGFDRALALARQIAATVNALHAVVALDEQSAHSLGLDGPAAVVRAGGVERAVAALLDQARALARASTTPMPSDPAFWQSLTDLEGAVPRGLALLVRCSVPPARLADAAAALRSATADLQLWAYADSGLLFAHLRTPTTALLPAIVQTARAAIEKLDGSLAVEAAPLQEKANIDLWGSPGDGLALMRRIKQQFDPNRTLSPGRFVGAI